MKKVLICVCLLATCLLPACSVNVAPKGMSPEETVQYYFAQYNDRNQSKMDSVTAPDMRGADFDLGNLNNVKLIRCEEEKDASKIDKTWSKGAYNTAMVNVTFDIDYKNGGSANAGLSNGTYDWQYNLVKEKESSDWMIVMWGVG